MSETLGVTFYRLNQFEYSEQHLIRSDLGMQQLICETVSCILFPPSHCKTHRALMDTVRGFDRGSLGSKCGCVTKLKVRGGATVCAGPTSFRLVFFGPTNLNNK
jgi:hypothetical protein